MPAPPRWKSASCDYRFVRRYLERHPQLPLSLRQVDPLIRQLTLYRDLIEQPKPQENERMNLIELQRALTPTPPRRHGRRAGNPPAPSQAEAMAPIDLISCLVSDELTRRSDRLLERRRKQAGFRDPNKTLDNFDFTFNPKMNRSLVFDLATGAFIDKREDALFLGPAAPARVIWPKPSARPPSSRAIACSIARRTSCWMNSPKPSLDGTRKEYMESLATVPLLIIDDFGMRKLPHTAAEDLLEIIMRRYERASTLLTSNRPVEDWGKLLGDAAAVSAMLDRLLHHGHVLKCGPTSWRTKTPAGVELWKCRAVETVENQTAVSPCSHRAWKTRHTSAIPTVPTGAAACCLSSAKNAINRPAGARWRRNYLPDLPRAGYNNCCSECCSIGRFWSDRHWPDLR